MLKILFLTLFAGQLFGMADAQAVSLAGRQTNDTVCDLSPMTNDRLSSRVFIPAGTMRVSDIYARLAIGFVTKECKDSQLLILHSDIGNSVDERSFREVYTEVCDPASVQRESTATSDYPYSFQVKCRLAKLQEASIRLRAAEREKPLDKMIAENAPIRRQESQSDAEKGKETNCSEKLSLSQVLGIGGGCGR